MLATVAPRFDIVTRAAITRRLGGQPGADDGVMSAVRAPVIQSSQDGLHVVSVERVLFALWEVVPTMASMRRLQVAGDRHRDTLNGRKQVFVNVVEGGIPNFTDEVRKEAVRHAQRSAPWRLATAHIVLIPGMRGVAVRSFMSTMLLLGKPPVPTRVFNDMTQAAQWLAAALADDSTWTSALLISTYRSTRAAVLGDDYAPR